MNPHRHSQMVLSLFFLFGYAIDRIFRVFSFLGAEHLEKGRLRLHKKRLRERARINEMKGRAGRSTLVQVINNVLLLLLHLKTYRERLRVGLKCRLLTADSSSSSSSSLCTDRVANSCTATSRPMPTPTCCNFYPIP